MLLKFRIGMLPDAIVALMEEIRRIDQCYAEAAEYDAKMAAEHPAPEHEEYDCFNPVRDGWVGKDGRP